MRDLYNLLSYGAVVITGLALGWYLTKGFKMSVTAAQVQAGVLAKHITKIDHHKCAICGHTVFYSVIDGSLFFNAGCGCQWESPRAANWQEAANYINMQTDETVRLHVMKQFGLEA
jgi:hypothetical protein